MEISDGDIILIADKVIAMSEGRLERYDRLEVSKRAKELAKKYGLEGGFVELVLREAEEILGGIEGTLLTISRGILIANSGVDRKNVPQGYASLWPRDPYAKARELRERIEERTGKKVGLILVDSRVLPLRRGTVGVAIGFSGIEPVEDVRGKPDIYGKPLKITFVNKVDDLASIAHLLMGETDELVPFVIVRNAPVKLSEELKLDVKMKPEECLYMRELLRKDQDLT